MVQVHALPHVLSWARQQAAAADPAAAERIEWTDIVVGGHSRGAEVAARTAARFPAHGLAAPLPKEFPNGTPAAHLDTACAGGCEERQLRVLAVLLVDPVAKQPATVPLINPQQPFYAIGDPPPLPSFLLWLGCVPSASTAPSICEVVHLLAVAIAGGFSRAVVTPSAPDSRGYPTAVKSAQGIFPSVMFVFHVVIQFAQHGSAA